MPILDSKHTLYLIDISSFIFRAFFAIRSLKSKTGEPTNAVYGVATMLAKLADEAQPEYLAVVYDSKEPSFRKEIYPEYKANRSEAPDDLIPQFARIEELIRCFEIHSYRESGIEADDLIATLTKNWCKISPENHVVVVSSDKDLMQLVTDRVCIWDTMSNKFYNPPEVEAKFGVKPTQIRDYLALVGDSSDNIPGVPSIGPKSASDLLKEFETLEGILEAAKEGKIAGKKGETLKTHEKDARLSAELATVREDLKVDFPLELLKYRFHITEDCAQLLKALDFHSLVAKWKIKTDGMDAGKEKVESKSEKAEAVLSSSGGLQIEMLGTAFEPDPRFRTVNTEKDLDHLLNEMARTRQFGFDLETTSLNPRDAEIVGIAICYDHEFACYIPIGHQGSSIAQLPKTQVLEALRPFIENPDYKKIGQNLKYDWSVLRSLGWNPQGIGADTMVAAYLLDPEGRHNLQKLADQYLDYQVMTYEQVCGKGANEISFSQIDVNVATRYSAEDAWIAMRLWSKLKLLLDEEKLSEVFYQIDLPLVPVLMKMELAGVSVDTSWLEMLSNEFNNELKAIQDRIQSYTQGPVNLNSPKQLAVLLFDQLKLPTQGKTKTGFSTDAQVLEALAPLHEVPRLLLEYREISKLKGTYVDPLPQMIDRKSGKIHASFHQTVTATGRLSSSDPNLQNIPVRSERGMRIRRAFIPSEGNLLVSADYSQIELRLMAHMSGDPVLTQAFQNNEDVHKRTASEIYGVPEDRVDDQMRSVAKAINFGLMYGKSVFGLAQELKIPRREAKEMIDRYFERYRCVKDFLDRQILEAKERGYVMSLMGRKRRLPDILSKNAAIRGNAERMAMNTPLQATAADLIKLAMIEIDRRLTAGGYRSKLIIQVHDEVVLDCPKDEVPEIQKLVTEAMENAMTLSIKLSVNTAVGKNWMDL